MRCSKPFVLVCAIVSGFVFPSGLRAQVDRRGAYFSAQAGLAADPPQFSVRSDRGLALAVGAGRYVSEHFALEGQLGGQLFGAPVQIINPGGCPGQAPTSPCILPQPSAVHVATLAGDLVWSGSRGGITPLLIAGDGLRYITEAPEESPQLRPLAEIGAGVGHSFGTASVAVEGRIQVAAWTAGLPRWTAPIGISVRVF
jgi:hypothetical protein